MAARSRRNYPGRESKVRATPEGPDNAAMPASALSQRLLIQPAQQVLTINAPAGYLDSLRPLPEGASIAAEPDGVYDAVHLFAENRSVLERHAEDARKALKPGGTLWIAYLNPAALRGSDLTRDHGWGVLHGAGLVAVKQVEIDRTWVALRFQPVA